MAGVVGPDRGGAQRRLGSTLPDWTDARSPFPQTVPRLPFEQIKNGNVDPGLRKRILETGTVIVEGAVKEEVSPDRPRFCFVLV